MSFRRCLSVHMFAFLGRQLYFYTAGKRKEEREKKIGKKANYYSPVHVRDKEILSQLCITKMRMSFTITLDNFIQIPILNYG